jgi:hypothetical protein
MAPSDIETITIRFTAEERQLIEDLATMRSVTTSDVVRELMGFQRESEAVQTARPSLRVVSA